MVATPARTGRPPAAVLRGTDWALGAAVAVLQVFAPRSGAAGPEAVAPWTGALVAFLAVGQGAGAATVRRRPLPAACLVVACYAGQALVVGTVPPLAAWVVIWVLGSARSARAGSVRLAAAVAVATCGVVIGADVVHPGSGASALLSLVTGMVTLAAVLLRSERARVDAVRRQSAVEERLRLARDLHDLVGHGLSVVAVQSSTARMALDAGRTAMARAAMTAVESSSRTAMAELRHMLGVLTSDSGEAAAPGLGDVETLVGNVRAGGVVVDLETGGDLGAVPPGTQLCAYRIVQEALTNAVKHAPGSRVRVRIRAADRGLAVAVRSTGGSPTHPERGGGSGLAGLRARVAALGGEMRAEPTADGWLVRCELPLPPPDRPATARREGWS